MSVKVILLAALIVAAPEAGAAGIEGLLYTRPIEEVPAGHAIVLLDAHALAHGTTDGSWLVTGPDGDPVAQTVVQPHSGQVLLTARAAREQGDGWGLIFDVGPVPLRHDEFSVSPGGGFSALGCRLEGSWDGESWVQLARGDMFLLSKGGGLGQLSLEYEPTDARYLRLFWPRAAGFPKLRGATVTTLPEPSAGPVPVDAISRAVGAEGGLLHYQIELPGGALFPVRLVLPLNGEGTFPYRLYHARDGIWEGVREGVLESEDGFEIPWIDSAMIHPVLRLDLYETDAGAPPLERATVVLPPLWIVFEAQEAGAYQLGYRRVGPTAPRGGKVELKDLSRPVARVKLGPAERADEPAPPERLFRPSGEAEGTVAVSWPVQAEGAAPGDVIRLELPLSAYADTRNTATALSLRLTADGQELPYAHHRPIEPSLIVEERGIAPSPSGRSGESEITLELPLPTHAVSSVEILTSDGPFRRTVRTSAPREGRPGVEDRTRESRKEWICLENPVPPCRLAARPPRGPSSTVRIAFEDGGEPPIEAVDVTVWRKSDVLLFVWPDAEEVRLLRIHDGERPAYELSQFGDRLLRSDWIEASLDEEAMLQSRAGREKIWKGALVAMLVVAGLALLWILSRSLPRRSRNEKG